MRNFHPGVLVYDLAEQIYLQVKTNSFTHAEITRAKIQASPGNLTRLRNWGVLEHPPDKTKPSIPGIVRPRRLPGPAGARYWVMTPKAIRVICRHRGEPLPEGVPAA
jgi:hypothetical protein